MEPNQNKAGSRVLMGLFFTIGGILLFAYKLGAPIPGWLFTWPMILIVLGFLISIKHRFRTPGGLVMMAIGGIFLADKLSPALDFKDYVAPVIIILVGLSFLLRPNRGRFRRGWNRDTGNDFTHHSGGDDSSFTDDDDFIDSTAVFGGVKKMIVSKNFKGGDITCFMGGTELNLMQADSKDKIMLDVTQIFGGTKLIVPPNWNIKSEVVTLFGGIEDKRPATTLSTPLDKVLVLKGTSIFGGIDIRSY